MKNKVKLIVNPFIRIAGGQALIWGFLGLIVSTLLCWISGYHYHGLLHFGPAPNPAWWSQEVSWLVQEQAVAGWGKASPIPAKVIISH